MAVVGLDAIGEALFHLLHSSGHNTIGFDNDRGILDRIGKTLAEVANGSQPRGQVTLTSSIDKQCFETADLVFITSSEDPETVRTVLQQLDSVCKSTVVLATALGRLSLFSSALASGRPTQTLGLRFLMPPETGISVEVVSTSFSSALAMESLEAALEDMGLNIAAIGSGPVADATDLIFSYLNRAVAMLDSGYATRDDIDNAMRLGCGFRYGPLELLDRIGLDAVCTRLTNPSPLLTRMVQTGALGVKVGRGFYDYNSLRIKVDDGQNAIESIPLRSVAVIGSGVMAKGIAQVAAMSGFDTVLVARSPEKAASAMEAIEGAFRVAVRRGSISVSGKNAALDRISVTHDMARLRSCEVVIEAVVEDAGIKLAIFEELGSICQRGTLLATTTSSLSVTECAAVSRRPGDVVGLHFFNPAPKMELVELVRTSYTSPATLSLSRAFCRALDKSVVECTDRSGFIVNWLLFPYLAQAVRLLERADVDVESLDGAITRGFGHRLGPFGTLDIVGLDVSEAIMARLHHSFPESDFEVPRLISQMVRLGLLGRKTSIGFFSASARRHTPH
ncbi:3-hydroxyacyl-CoA dehydrogenase family protein [Streptomyces sp. NPDC056254]|uniref:3-hydroxyacyl-CoA dehydrogenase family protein n=1 Tax=Streptomyces sp. NPDC056254 TaxID=3345763 RepID=UPI0035E0758F